MILLAHACVQTVGTLKMQDYAAGKKWSQLFKTLSKRAKQPRHAIARFISVRVQAGISCSGSGRNTEYVIHGETTGYIHRLRRTIASSSTYRSVVTDLYLADVTIYRCEVQKKT